MISYTIIPSFERIPKKEKEIAIKFIELAEKKQSQAILTTAMVAITTWWVYDKEKRCYVDDVKECLKYVNAQTAILGYQEYLDRVNKKVMAKYGKENIQ